MRQLTLDHSQNPVYLSIQHAQITFYHFHRQELGTLGNFGNYWHQGKRKQGLATGRETTHKNMKHLRCVKAHVKTRVRMHMYLYHAQEKRSCRVAQDGLRLVLG